jgi:nicotinamidase/pyrazinamidase
MAGIQISRETDAFLVIDVQNDFCPGGALAVPEGDAVVPIIDKLMDRFDTIVLTQDWHPEGHASFASTHGAAPFSTREMPYGTQVLWPDHCIAGDQGAAFHPSLRLRPAQMVQRKGTNPAIDSYSAFYENDRTTSTGLAGWLREKGVTRVFVAGLATDFCVAWTCMDARRCGFEAVMIEDASRPIDQNGSLAAAMENMENAGVIVTRENLIGE